MTIALALPLCRRDPALWVQFVYPDLKTALALAYVVFVTTAFNYGAMAWANKRSSPAFVTTFAPLQLIFTALLPYAIGALTTGAGGLGSGSVVEPTPLGLFDVAGGLLICGGLVLLARSATAAENGNASE